MATASNLAQRLRELGRSRQAVVLDLDGVEFIDMSGLRVLLAAVRDAAAGQRPLVLTTGSSVVRRLAAIVDTGGHLVFDRSEP